MAENSSLKFITHELPDWSEADLWLSFKSGSETALSHIFKRFYNDLYNYSMKICKDEDLAKDCIQNLFIGLWKNRETLGDVQSVKFYLIKSLRRSLLRAMEKESHLKFDLDFFKSKQPDVMFSHEEIIIRDENASQKKENLAKLLNELPKRQKEAIYLKYYDNLSYEEIADLMGLNYQSVVNHIHKAFKTLKKFNYTFLALEGGGIWFVLIEKCLDN